MRFSSGTRRAGYDRGVVIYIYIVAESQSPSFWLCWRYAQWPELRRIRLDVLTRPVVSDLGVVHLDRACSVCGDREVMTFLGGILLPN